MQIQDTTTPTAIMTASAVKQWLKRLVWVSGGHGRMWHLTGSRQATVTALCGTAVPTVKRRDAQDEPESRQCAGCLTARRRVTQGCQGTSEGRA